MSDTPTPRTEAELGNDFGLGSDKNSWPCCYVEADFARTLERELAEARADAERLADALVSIGEYWNQAPESAVDAAEYARDTAAEALAKHEALTAQ